MNTAQVINRLALRALATRALSTTAIRNTPKPLGYVPNAAGYRKMQELQTEMTRDDGLLVWQKRGLRDRMPYFLSLVLCVAGMGLAVANLWDMSFPKKKE